jgi:hypothetical protein
MRHLSLSGSSISVPRSCVVTQLNLTFMGPCIVIIFQYISNKCNVTQFILSGNCSTFSGDTITHHQERKQLYLQHLVFVTPLLLSAAIVEELEMVWVCCGWRMPGRGLCDELIKTDRHPCPRWYSNPETQQASGHRPTPQTARPLGPAYALFTCPHYLRLVAVIIVFIFFNFKIKQT